MSNRNNEQTEKLGNGVAGEEIEESGARGLVRLALVGFALLLSWIGVWRLWFPVDVIALCAVFFGGIPVFRGALFALKAKSITMEVAMTAGILASLIVGEFLAAGVIVFFTLSADFIDAFTIARGRSSINELIKISPKTAVVKRDRREVKVDVKDLERDDVVVVKSGEKIPVDGTVIGGYGSVNQAPITGESAYVEKSVGDRVFAGSINELGALEIKVTKVAEDTTLGKIIAMVEKAESSKAPIQKFSDRFAARFVPIVLGVAFLLFLATQNVTSSIAVVVVACPCAIALGTPLAVVASVGKAARKGIIVKGGVHLQELSEANTVVMDKTGTLTLGEPQVVEVKGFRDHDETEIVELAAIAEKHSEHPLAQAISKKAEEHGIRASDHEECRVIPGQGVICKYMGGEVIMGNRDLLHQKRIPISGDVDHYMNTKESEGKTTTLIAHDGAVCGVICVADVIRKETIGAIRDLKKLGIQKLVMVTGDNPRTAKSVAVQVGIDEVYAEMMPEEKVEKVKELVKQRKHVIMIGDGVNDAPALAEASVGIAMGAVGTDVAVEAADVALMTDDLRNVVEAIMIGRNTFNVIRQNIYSSIVFNVVGVALASMGILNPLAAAAAHTLPDVLLFLNSSKLLWK